jgi:hypothetical protein
MVRKPAMVAQTKCSRELEASAASDLSFLEQIGEMPE